jgi:hypothetical protein
MRESWQAIVTKDLSHLLGNEDCKLIALLG